MLDHLTQRLNGSGTSMRNLGMEQRKISPEMQAAIDRGRAAIKQASLGDTKSGKKSSGLKLKGSSSVKRK